METFRKEYGKYIVDFNNSNEYVEMGSLDANPKFSGILIREQFTNKGIELFIPDIKFFRQALSECAMMTYSKDTPVCKMVHNFGWNNYSSDFAIVISDYKGLRCKFFTNITHQYNLVYDSIRSNSPEFTLDIILEILKDAEDLIEERTL